MLKKIKPNAAVLLFIILFLPVVVNAQVEKNMEEIKFVNVENIKYGRFEKGIWEIGENPDEKIIKQLEKEHGPLKIFAVDGIGVLFLNDSTEIGGKAGCYTLEDMDNILKMRIEKRKYRDMLEKEIFFNEKFT